MKSSSVPRALLLLTLFAGCFARHNDVLTAAGGQLSDVDIECDSDSIAVTVTTSGGEFNGMVYPRGLSENSSCLAEYEHADRTITYRLPLRSCNTMSHDVSEGVEYFNTVVIQPHSKLVTSLGRGFHVRCRYQTKNKTDTPSNAIGTTPAKSAAPLPTCSMHIYAGRPSEHVIAEHARIGEYLTLLISIDEQETYGLQVSNCIVKDGLGWSEQPLINNDGCPIDPDVMGPFEYSENLTRAQVTYPAHKFPFTASVYYKCNVKLCTKKNGGCDDVPPACDATGRNALRRRRKRQSELRERGSLETLRRQDEDARDRSVEVYGGLYVDEVDDDEETENPSTLPARSDDEFCVSTRKFAIGIAVAGVLLMLAVVLLVACVVHRRRRRKGTSTAGSSVYSGPYSNHAYSRD